jgi:hypothetical protein
MVVIGLGFLLVVVHAVVHAVVEFTAGPAAMRAAA